MDDLYSDNIIDHFKNPRHFGELEEADSEYRGSNASCGDLIEFSVKFGDGSGKQRRVVEAKFRGVGCAVSTAAASMLAELVNDKQLTVAEILALDKDAILKMLHIAVSPSRERCMLLSLNALQGAVDGKDAL